MLKKKKHRQELVWQIIYVLSWMAIRNLDHG